MTEKKAETFRLASADELDIEKTFECGQCFRWNRDENGVYRGVVKGYPAKVYTEGSSVFIRTAGDEGMWRDYFDLERDYSAINDFDGGDYLRRCIEYGRGIRILNQEPWETLCSFIISQCNNIKRIKGIVEKLCSRFGDELCMDGERYMSFPGPERLRDLGADDLDFLRAGYRAPYIISAASDVSRGNIDLDSLADVPAEEARKELLKLRGVGVKVADCVVLFGLRHMEAFPIDVWIKRALKENFPPDFRPESLGGYAGLAQQYMYFYARSGGR